MLRLMVWMEQALGQYPGRAEAARTEQGFCQLESRVARGPWRAADAHRVKKNSHLICQFMAEYRRRKRPLNAPHHSENLQVSLLRMASGDACYCCDHHDRPRTRPLAQQFMDRAICRYLHLGLPLRQAGSSCSDKGGCGKKRGDDRVKAQSLISPLAFRELQKHAPPSKY